MSSPVFEYIYQYTGIYLDPAYLILGLLLLVILLFILVIVALCKLKKMSRKYKAFMKGKDVESMEDTIIACISKGEEVEQMGQALRAEMNGLSRRMSITYQKIGIVKYDAFRGMSGNLSYTLALLDQEDNGFVMNAVYSREGGYSYIKEIKKGGCEIALSEEEVAALEKAKSRT